MRWRECGGSESWRRKGPLELQTVTARRAGVTPRVMGGRNGSPRSCRCNFRGKSGRDKSHHVHLRRDSCACKPATAYSGRKQQRQLCRVVFSLAKNGDELFRLRIRQRRNLMANWEKNDVSAKGKIFRKDSRLAFRLVISRKVMPKLRPSQFSPGATVEGMANRVPDARPD